MSRLFLIRHGAPDAAWGAAHDPGLSPLGRIQAEAAAARLAGEAGLLMIASPMRRCRETAAPLEAALGVTARIEPRVSEVATPQGLADRRAWLGATFPWRAGTTARVWSSVDPALHVWRASVLAAVREIEHDTAVFTHFIAINVIVGAALNRDDTIVCRPNYASITELTVDTDELHLVALGEEMAVGEVG